MKVIQSDNACSAFDEDYYSDEGPSLKCILNSLEKAEDVKELRKVYEYHWKGLEKDIIDLDFLIQHLNYAFPTDYPTCSFCKAKRNKDKIIIFTSDEKALKWLKSKIVDEQYQWDCKTRTVEGESVEYWIIAFKYVNFIEFLGKSLIQSIKDDWIWLDELWEDALWSSYEED